VPHGMGGNRHQFINLYISWTNIASDSMSDHVIYPLVSVACSCHETHTNGAVPVAFILEHHR